MAIISRTVRRMPGRLEDVSLIWTNVGQEETGLTAEDDSLAQLAHGERCCITRETSYAEGMYIYVDDANKALL